jgi:hypothetical protein
MAPAPADGVGDGRYLAPPAAGHDEPPGVLQLGSGGAPALPTGLQEPIEYREALRPGPGRVERLEHRRRISADHLLEAHDGTAQLAGRHSKQGAGPGRRHVQLDPEHLGVIGQDRRSRVQPANQRVERGRPLPRIRHGREPGFGAQAEDHCQVWRGQPQMSPRLQARIPVADVAPYQRRERWRWDRHLVFDLCCRHAHPSILP